MAIGNVLLIYYFVITAHYLRIKQQFEIAKLHEIILKLNSNLTNAKVNRSLQLFATLEQFRSVNQKILKFFDDIRGHNRLWSKYLSAYFSSYILVICYLSYGFATVPEDSSLFQKGYFLFFATEFFVILLWLTLECSLITRKNVQIYQFQRRFYLTVQQYYPLGTQDLLKVRSSNTFCGFYLKSTIIFILD